MTCKVLLVEDYSALNPFDGVSNHPTFLVLKRDAVNVFPVPYRSWTPGAKVAFKLHRYSSAADFRKTAKCNDGLAAPVPGGNGARPWLVGSAAEQAVFKDLFASPEPAYKARKGVTTDRNGIYWVEALASTSIETVTVRNAADIGRTKGIPVVTGSIETKHLFRENCGGGCLRALQGICRLQITNHFSLGFLRQVDKIVFGALPDPGTDVFRFVQQPSVGSQPS